MKVKTILKISLVFTIGLIWTNTLTAQSKKEQYRIKIIKNENGESKTIDTTFTSRAAFDAFQKTQIPHNMTMDMLQLEQYKDQLKDGTIETQIGDSTVTKKLKVIRLNKEEKDLEKIYGAKDAKELLKILNIDLDSIVGTVNTEAKIVNIYSRVDLVDVPLSVVKNNFHPEMQKAATEEKLVLKGVDVYPNPSNGKVFLDLETGEPGEIKLLVTDMQGKEIFRDKFFNYSATTMQRNINIDGHKSGVYLLKITSGDKSVVKKLIFE